MMRFSAMVCIAVVAVTAAGCARSQSGNGARKSSRSDTPSVFSAVLNVRMDNVGSKVPGAPGIVRPATMACTRSIPATCSARLVCPVLADAPEWHPKACDYLADNWKKIIAPPPINQVCTEIYGGREIVRVQGWVQPPRGGKKLIDAAASREGGCEIARFDLLAPLWGAPRTAEAPSPRG